ncbi:MAG TPA: hypothetical protein VFS40_09185 [Gemmatimonadales bacterium]|nr:hypothetical protein [Gemmatimonadales bacterium]
MPVRLRPFPRPFARLLPGVALIGLVAAAPAPAPAAPPRTVTVMLTPADARTLVAEALAPRPGASVTVRVDSLYGAGDRVRLRGSAQVGPLDCALRLAGRPALLANRITLEELDIQTDRFDCQLVLGVARSYITDALRQRPWNLTQRLAEASRDSTLPGPRLAGVGCVREDQLELARVDVQAPDLRVDVVVHDPPAGSSCR